MWAFDNTGGGQFRARQLWSTFNFDIGSAGLVRGPISTWTARSDLVLPGRRQLRERPHVPAALPRLPVVAQSWRLAFRESANRDLRRDLRRRRRRSRRRRCISTSFSPACSTSGADRKQRRWCGSTTTAPVALRRGRSTPIQRIWSPSPAATSTAMVAPMSSRAACTSSRPGTAWAESRVGSVGNDRESKAAGGRRRRRSRVGGVPDPAAAREPASAVSSAAEFSRGRSVRAEPRRHLARDPQPCCSRKRPRCVVGSRPTLLERRLLPRSGGREPPQSCPSSPSRSMPAFTSPCVAICSAGRVTRSPSCSGAATRVDPRRDMHVHFLIGRNYLRLEQPAAAVLAFEKARDYPPVAYHLARTLLRLERRPAADRAIEAGRQAAPADPSRRTISPRSSRGSTATRSGARELRALADAAPQAARYNPVREVRAVVPDRVRPSARLRAARPRRMGCARPLIMSHRIGGFTVLVPVRRRAPRSPSRAAI